MINSAPYARNMADRAKHTTLVTVVSSILTVLLSKGMGVQEAHEGTDILIKTIQIRENAKGQISLRKFARKLRKHSASSHTSTRNVVRTNDSENDSDSDYSS